jgi:hypothetical protein
LPDTPSDFINDSKTWRQDMQNAVDANNVLTAKTVNQCESAPAWAVREKGALKSSFLSNAGNVMDGLDRSRELGNFAAFDPKGKLTDQRKGDVLIAVDVAAYTVAENKNKVEAACDPLKPIGLGTPYSPPSRFK